MNNNSALGDAVSQVFGRTALGIKPSLEVIEALLEKLGNPQKSYAVVHVAGTNGKGSVCRMIESTLVRSGVQTALYTSPHLINLNERYRFNCAEITDQDLAKLLERVEKVAQEIESDGIRGATFFEICTAVAFLYFKEIGAQVVILETGLGGRWDATNVVDPLISVITRIDLDHKDFLGETIEEIAAEKGGIIKPKRPVVLGAMPKEANATLAQIAKENRSTVIPATQSVSVKVLDIEAEYQSLEIETQNELYSPVNLKLIGTFQQENVATAVTAIEYIGAMLQCDLEMIEGLENTFWPSRFERIKDNPPFILDGAHNPSAAQALVKSLETFYPNFEVGFVVGVMADKDVSGILKPIGHLAKKIWMTQLSGDRALDLDGLKLQSNLLGLNADVDQIPLVLESADKWAKESPWRVVCVCGSLFWRNELVELNFL